MTACTKKAEAFFQKSILPELLGKFFSRTSGPIDASTTSVRSNEVSDIARTDDNSNDDEPQQAGDTYCYCQGPEIPPMIGCNNQLCPYGAWNH